MTVVLQLNQQQQGQELGFLHMIQQYSRLFLLGNGKTQYGVYKGFVDRDQLSEVLVDWLDEQRVIKFHEQIVCNKLSGLMNQVMLLM